MMRLRIEGAIWYWRGPAPFHFVTVPAAESELIHEIASVVTYGWGMIPASVTVGETTVTTALWPKDGGYIVPIKKALQDREGLGVDDVIEVILDIDA
ncbi:hypothetical protein L687_09280 [Microbacterium maritypicum MF109]|uniref:DUF1905 domain-containing protein n=2 Tax=Microbacteriaceae TaxID=85023 RepID=T5L407_MICMQ|nr:hypothetical protein L687_09280 [Microbacterium maritypicum MF109]